MANITMSAEEYDKLKGPKVLTQGQKKAAGMTLGADLGLVGLQALFNQQQVNRLKKELKARQKELTAPVLTDKDFATANMQAEAIEREIDALEGSRGTVGGSGAREDIKKRSQRKGLQRYASDLTELAQSELGRRKGIADIAAQQSAQLTGAQLQKGQDLVSGLQSIRKDEDLAGLFGRAGKQQRNKDKEGYKAATGTVDEQFESTIGTRRKPFGRKDN